MILLSWSCPILYSPLCLGFLHSYTHPNGSYHAILAEEQLLQKSMTIFYFIGSHRVWQYLWRWLNVNLLFLFLQHNPNQCQATT